MRQFLITLSQKLSIPTASIAQNILTHKDGPTLTSVIRELQKRIGGIPTVSKDDQRGVDDDNIVLNFFIFGIYPVEYVESIELYIRDYIIQFPDRLEKVIGRLTPTQMVRLVMRIQNEFSSETRDVVLSKIQEIRRVVNPDNLRKLGPLNLTDVVRRVDDVQYLIRHWVSNEKIRAEVSFNLDELVAAFVQEFPLKSGTFFISLPTIDLNQILEAIKPESKKIILKLIDEVERDEVSSATEPSAATEDKLREEPALEEPIYIKNAGLVILYPFLSRYFKLLNLLSNDRKGFKDEYSVQKAVHLLHFLVFDEQQGKEYEMTLNKLICGMPFSIPLEKDVSLTEEEIQTSESLLKGAIQNWEIIKSSSISNFQGSFLIRDGRLIQGEQAWSLKVEQRAYDMLLDKIPWSFNIVKLPWMKKAIHVEWR